VAQRINSKLNYKQLHSTLHDLYLVTLSALASARSTTVANCSIAINLGATITKHLQALVKKYEATIVAEAKKIDDKLEADTDNISAQIAGALLAARLAQVGVELRFQAVGADRPDVDPAAALLSVLNASAGSGGGDTAYTTTLFLSSPCGTLPPVGAPLLLLVNQVAGEAAVAATLALAAQLPDEGAAAQAAALPFVQPLGSLASVITLLANQSASAAACPPLYSGVWLEVR
jgi:hypothetical protein